MVIISWNKLIRFLFETFIKTYCDNNSKHNFDIERDLLFALWPVLVQTLAFFA